MAEPAAEPTSFAEEPPMGKPEQQDGSGHKKNAFVTPKAKLMQRALKQQAVVSG